MITRRAVRPLRLSSTRSDRAYRIVRRTEGREHGAGLITSILGTFFVLATVYACVDILVTMHRRTVVTAVADDLARRLARDVSLDPTTEANLSARSLGPGVQMTAVTNGDDVVVAVSARGPRLLPFEPFDRFSRIERTMRARRELFGVANR